MVCHGYKSELFYGNTGKFTLADLVYVRTSRWNQLGIIQLFTVDLHRALTNHTQCVRR